ncbi:hypothetical protein [Arthrobacter antibioticus]|uniref:hypothetical protein n=1 Tax=Arthrobacter sp. H35-MC1 TaxID=3046203 RepID=UPI0024B8FDA9|nr:hypothetical protein [Arthrobacter sp. H35-MC1]MDJ0318890.1 hypothetical protein [Arthrobacter sp. H35-MC1]
MSTMETVYAVSDPKPTVAAAIGQLASRIDENVRGIQQVFEASGDQLWSAESASHTVTPVTSTERMSRGMVGHDDVLVTQYVASAILLVTFQKKLD